ncbi:hypothetical protein ACJ73_09139 [Blastomyces percursus]|uniref:Uncharacterized protein n=1 Tax=Blastomyces percursus TaxID=1658174 RepID=A0A1J9QFG4_9EURO|nr:hypothetical protein ACJ73_09139 [Blastomyces percursus]
MANNRGSRPQSSIYVSGRIGQSRQSRHPFRPSEGHWCSKRRLQNTGSLTAKLAASTSTPKMHHLSGIPGPLRKRCSSAPRPCRAASESHSWEARYRIRDILASASSVKRQKSIGVGRRVWM